MPEPSGRLHRQGRNLPDAPNTDDLGEAVWTSVLLRCTPAMLLILDQHGCIVAASQRWLAHFGYTAGQVLQRPLADLMVPGAPTSAGPAGNGGFCLPPRCDGAEYLMQTARQAHVAVALFSETIVSGHPAQTRVHVVFQDITALRTREAAVQHTQQALQQANQVLHAQNALLRSTLQSIGDGVVTTDAGGIINWLNPAAATLTGWPLADAVGLPLARVCVTVDRATRQPVQRALPAVVQAAGSPRQHGQSELLARDGRVIAVEESLAPILDQGGQVLGGVLVLHDVSERRRLSDRLQHLATHDALTGLLNRTEFEARLLRCIERLDEDGRQHALLFIDLDQFKLVNDTCGQRVGDELLRQVGRMLRDGVRARDTLARLGGDEFAVLLEHCSVEQATRIASDICKQMENLRFGQDSRYVRLGASIGLVPVDQRWTSLADVLQAGDACCHVAKVQGRNRVHVWVDSDAIVNARQAETRWAQRIEGALQDDRFALFFQRIEPLQPGGSGWQAEVLLRLVGVNGRLEVPGAFLPAAERFNLASRIDLWVLRQVLARLAALPHTGDIDVLCINLSGRSLADRNFHHHVLEALRGLHVEVRHCLCFEISETVAVTHLSDAAVFMQQVRALGVRIALDGFGSGPSSFAYLKQLPVDLLKIDGQLVHGVVSNPLDEVAVRSFVEVARVMGVKTVAESVESPAVLQRLRELGVDAAQGYLLHRPVPLDAWLNTLSAAPSP